MKNCAAVLERVVRELIRAHRRRRRDERDRALYRANAAVLERESLDALTYQVDP